MTRRVLIGLVVAFVVAACVAGYVFVLAVPDYRTAVLVDASAPGAGLAEVAGAVRSVADNSGDSDALSLRRFGGECGSPDNTAEIADSPDEIAQAVGTLSPSGKATMVDGVMAAIDGFSGLLSRRGSVRNRIIVVSTSGLDACAGDPARARRAIDDRMAEEGLELDIRVVGYKISEDRKTTLTQFADDTEFADSADDLAVVLDQLVVPDSPEATSISVSAPAPEPDPSYAFTTTSRLGIVRGTKVVAEVAGDFTISGGPQYTKDGHFAFAATPAGIAVIDVSSGADRVVPCGECSYAVATADGVISWLAGNVVTTLDLADPGAQPEPGVTVLPDRQVDEANSVLPLRILTSRDGKTLISAPDGVSAYGGGAENLYVIGSGGDVVPVGTAQGNVAIPDASFSPDGRSVAYIAAGHAGACETRSSVVLIDLATGVHTETPPVGDPLDDGSGVMDLWYDQDGTLNMIYTSWRCEASGGPVTSVTLPEGRWQLEDSGWTQREPDSEGNARQVTPGFRAVLASPGQEAFAYELYSEVDGARTKIADDVLSIAVPD